MPSRPPKVCAAPGCYTITKRGRCDKHRTARNRQIDSRRGKTAERGYGSRWRRARATYLQQNPLCRDCESNDRITAATVVDHIIDHKGDQQLFWDQNNWQPLCKPCHDRKTAVTNLHGGGAGRKSTA